MSETHTRGEDIARHPITGEESGISEILERRSNGEAPETRERDPEPKPREDDDEERAAREVASLRTRATEAEARAAEADRRRALAERDRSVAVQGAEDTGFTAIATALGAATREKEGLIAELKSAGESGDFGRMGEINVRLGELGAELRDLTRGKDAYEQERQRRLDRPPERNEPVAGSATERGILAMLGAGSRDQFLANRTEPTARWLREHGEFFTDAAAHDRIVGADALAKGRGLEVDTPAYFKFIEEQALDKVAAPRREREERGTPTPGAAPSRDAPGPTGRDRGSRDGDIYVSSDDRKSAEWMGVDPVDYVREKERLTRTGEYPYRRR